MTLRGRTGRDVSARLRATLDSLLDPHVVLTAVRDAQGRIIDFEFTDANSAACAYNGMTYEELMGRRLLEFLPAHATSGLFGRYVRLIETGESLVLDDFVHPVELLGGVLRHFDIRGVALGDSMVYTWRDVTDRHEQVRALADAEREYRCLAEATTDMAYRTASDRTIVWVSPSVRRVLGWSPEQMIGRTIVEFAAHEEAVRFASDREAVYAGEMDPDLHPERVFRMRAADGREVPMTAVVSRDLDTDGQWSGGLLVGLRDVTQVLAERERARRLQLSMDRAAIGMAITSTQGVFEYVNPALARMLGYQQADLEGVSLCDITHPDDRDASEAMLHRLADDAVDTLSLRKRYVTLGGQTIWVDLAVAAARHDDGRLDHFVAQIVDVTAEVEYAEALERTVRRFRLLAENASDVVYETDAAGVIRWISPSVQNVLGWEPKAVAGTLHEELLEAGQDQVLDEQRHRVGEGFSVTGRLMRYRTASGRSAWMSAKAHPIVDADGQVAGMTVGLRDVSDEVAVRQELSRLQRQGRHRG